VLVADSANSGLKSKQFPHPSQQVHPWFWLHTMPGA